MAASLNKSHRLCFLSSDEMYHKLLSDRAAPSKVDVSPACRLCVHKHLIHSVKLTVPGFYWLSEIGFGAEDGKIR